MKTTVMKTAAACGLCLTLLAGGSVAGAAFGGAANQMNGRAAFGQQGAMLGGQIQGGGQTAPFGDQRQAAAAQSTASSAGTIAEGGTTNSAASLTADYANAVTYRVDQTGSVKISEAGTYVVTGTAADANITVKKGTTGVVLVLRDLDLTSGAGAALSINKESEVKVVVSGSVKLTDNEDPADEASTDADVADAYDGAAIKVKAGASAYITGTGTLTLNGSAKNGIKAGDDTVLVLDGPTVNITAANDAINGNYDVAILSGTLSISAGDDAIHADRILTIGADGSGPDITIAQSYEGVEATVVNIAGGTVNVTSADDGVNAANSDGAYQSELAYSINVTGGSVTVNAPRADGFDSNGNINLVSGSATIRSANNGGDAGLDYDGSLYISDDFDLNNFSGVSNMGGGMMGGMPGQMGGAQQPGARGQQNQGLSGQTQGQTPDQNRQTTAPVQDEQRQTIDQNRQGMAQNRGMGQSSTQDQQNQLRQSPFGAPDQNAGRQPTRDQGMGQSGGVWIGGRWLPYWMLRQTTR